MDFERIVEDIMPCAAALGFFILLFGFIALMRWMRHRETMALAEKGLVPERFMRRRNGKSALRWGIAIAALGLALCVGLYPIGFIAEEGAEYPLRFGPWMLGGWVPLFFGLALVIIHYLTREKGERAEEPPPTVGGPEEEPPG